MDPYHWLNKFYNFYMAAVVSIVSRCDLKTEVYCKSQSNKTKLVLYCYFHFKSHLKQLYTSNKMEYFGYKSTDMRCLKEELAWAIDK